MFPELSGLFLLIVIFIFFHRGILFGKLGAKRVQGKASATGNP